MVSNGHDPIETGSRRLWLPPVRRGTIVDPVFARESLQALWNQALMGVMRTLVTEEKLLPAAGCAIAVSKTIALGVLQDARKLSQVLLDAKHELISCDCLAWIIENDDADDRVWWVGLEARLKPRFVAS